MDARIVLSLIGLALVAVITLWFMGISKMVMPAPGVSTAKAAQMMGLVEHQDENGEKMYSGIPADPDKQQEILEGLMEESMNPKGGSAAYSPN